MCMFIGFCWVLAFSFWPTEVDRGLQSMMQDAFFVAKIAVIDSQVIGVVLVC